jgi:hypothetical protein
MLTWNLVFLLFCSFKVHDCLIMKSVGNTPFFYKKLKKKMIRIIILKKYQKSGK